MQLGGGPFSQGSDWWASVFVAVVAFTSPTCFLLDLGFGQHCRLERFLFIQFDFMIVEKPPDTEAGNESTEGSEDHDEGKAAAFTVLLHGSLKVEGMVALVQLA